MKAFLTITFFVTALLVACEPQLSQEDITFREIRALREADFGPCERNSSTSAVALVAESRCLVFNVAENPEDPDGRQIPLKVMVVPAIIVEPEADPLVILAGGPGQAATDLVQVAQIFNRIRQNRDILLVDQRGTGDLSPLQCEFDDEEQINLSLEEILALQTEIITKCLNEFDASPQFYTTDIAVQDLEALREYLGYRQFNLWGGSYGTRVALAYLQAYPESTRTAVIDGVAPPSLALPMYLERDASSALMKVIEDCAAEENCAAAFPDLEAHLRQVVANLETSQNVIFRDAFDNTEREIAFDKHMFLALLRVPLYGRQSQRLIPFMIEQAYLGNFQPLAAVAPAETGINQSMFLSVICNEDLTLFDDSGMVSESNSNYLIASDLLTTPIIEACKLWPKREVPAAYFAPVSADVPVLIFSGALDPVTPPLWGEQVASTLGNSRHIIVEGFAHNTIGSFCTINIITDFIETGSLDNLQLDCLDNLRRRPFFVNLGGSSAADD